MFRHQRKALFCNERSAGAEAQNTTATDRRVDRVEYRPSAPPQNVESCELPIAVPQAHSTRGQDTEAGNNEFERAAGGAGHSSGTGVL